MRAWSLEGVLTPNDDGVSAVLVAPVASDDQVCFPDGWETEESSYEWKLCLARASGFVNVEAAINLSADVEPDSLKGKSTSVAYKAPSAAIK